MPEFWKSSGLQLVERTEQGWLAVTPELIRAYLARPEIHPVDESCTNEIALFESLMADPSRPVSDTDLDALADRDAADNYRIVLRYRDQLLQSGTLEGAYLDMMRRGAITVPPVFIDQLVHIVVGGMLASRADPMELRVGETLFREQSVNTDDGRVLLADAEIVERFAQSEQSGLGQLLAETGTPMRRIDLDILNEDNKHIYWDRSDRFDTVIDVRTGQSANTALARVIETWVRHFLSLEVWVTPTEAIEDHSWRWHIGLDRDATELLNALYRGEDVDDADKKRLLALYRMEIADQDRVQADVKGRPVYLAMAASPTKRLRLKPQNLLINMPLARTA